MKRTGRWMLLAGCCLVLGGCATPRPEVRDLVLRNDAETAKDAYESGNMVRAAELYGRARLRALMLDLPHEAGRNAYNEALCRTRLAQLSEARAALRQARLFLGDEGSAMAKVLVAEAEVAALQGMPGEAGGLAEAAVKIVQDDSDRVQAYLLLAELALRRTDAAAAKVFYRKATRYAGSGVPPIVSARLEAVAAGLIRSGEVQGDEGACHERRAARLREAGEYRLMGLSLKEAGTAYAAAGKLTRAFEMWIRAAASLKAAGEEKAAREAAQCATELAAKTGDRDLTGRAALLSEGFEWKTDRTVPAEGKR